MVGACTLSVRNANEIVYVAVNSSNLHQIEQLNTFTKRLINAVDVPDNHPVETHRSPVPQYQYCQKYDIGSLCVWRMSFGERLCSRNPFENSVYAGGGSDNDGSVVRYSARAISWNEEDRERTTGDMEASDGEAIFPEHCKSAMFLNPRPTPTT